MKLPICCALLLCAVALVASPPSGDERIPLLTVGSQTYTNAEVLDSSGTRLFIKHVGGLATIKLQDLDPKFQMRFGYDAAKVKELESVAEAPAKAWHETERNGRGNLVMVGAESGSAGRRTKSYSLRNTGDLTLSFPYSWKDTMLQTPAGTAPALVVRFDHEIADNFLLLVSSVTAASRTREMGLANTLNMVGNRALSGSVEKKLVLNDFQGEQASGYYFTLTDKSLVDGARKPGKYKYQTQGLVDVGGITLSFVICSNYLDTSDHRAALETIATAHFSPK